MKKNKNIILLLGSVILISFIIFFVNKQILFNSAYGPVFLILVIGLILLVVLKLIRKGSGILLVDFVFCIFVAGMLVLTITNLPGFLSTNGNGYTYIKH